MVTIEYLYSQRLSSKYLLTYPQSEYSNHMWYCAQTVSVLHEAELINGRASLTVLVGRPSQATAGEQGGKSGKASALTTASLWVLSPASISVLLHGFVNDVAAFKTARLLFPLTPFEIANLKNHRSGFFHVIKKRMCTMLTREMGCQSTPNSDHPPGKLLASV